MKLSVIVSIHDLEREAPRTLESLAPGYQRDVTPDDYEVVVLDNGSTVPFGKARAESYGPNFRYVYVDDALPSPAQAIDDAVATTRADAVCVMIDGARLLTPRVVSLTLAAFRAFGDPVVAVPGWYLGPGMQRISAMRGYNESVEDEQLAAIRWPEDGYRLFEISAPDEGWERGFLSEGKMAESNAISVRRSTWDDLGGFEPRFCERGGGLVNLDFFRRACDLAVARDDGGVVVLFSEGAFHQIHGGLATNVHPKDFLDKRQRFKLQYHAIRGKEWVCPTFEPVYFGTLVRHAIDYVAWSALLAPLMPTRTSSDHLRPGPRYPLAVRRYVQVLHERELDHRWPLQDSELEFTRMRVDLEAARREIAELRELLGEDPRQLAGSGDHP